MGSGPGFVELAVLLGYIKWVHTFFVWYTFSVSVEVVLSPKYTTYMYAQSNLSLRPPVLRDQPIVKPPECALFIVI